MASSPTTPSSPTTIQEREKVTSLLNDARLENDPQQKVRLLGQVEDLLLRRKSQVQSGHPLLEEFLQNVLEMHLDHAPAVRRMLAEFAERASREKPSLQCVRMCAETLLYLCNDANPNVIKSVISAATFVFKEALYIITTATSSNDIAEMWSVLSQLSRQIVECLDHDNDGVKSHSIHFIATLIMCFSNVPSQPLTVASRKGVNPTVSRQPKNDRVFHLGMIPPDHPLLNVSSLQKDAERYMALLQGHLAKEEVSSTNVSVALQALFNITKQRTTWWNEVVPLFCNLPTNMPPSLSSSQRKSIRISLKSMLLFLLKMPAMGKFRDMIKTTLNNKSLECRHELIDSAMRYVELATKVESNARGQKRKFEQGDDSAEASDVIEADGEIEDSTPVGTTTAGDSTPEEDDSTPQELPEKRQRTSEMQSSPSHPLPQELPTEYDTPVGTLKISELVTMVTTNFFQAQIEPFSTEMPDDELNLRAFANVVMGLASQMPQPSHIFIHNYISQPIPPPQSQLLQEAPMDPRRRTALAAQGKTLEQQQQEAQSTFAPIVQDDEMQMPQHQFELPMQELLTADTPFENEEELLEDLVQESNFVIPHMQEVHELSSDEKKFFLDMTWKRMLDSDAGASREASQRVRHVFLSKMAAKQATNHKWHEELISHIRGDLRKRLDLAMQWLTQEFSNEARDAAQQEEKGGTLIEMESAVKEDRFPRYTKLLHTFLSILETDIEPQFGLALSRFMLQLPIVTDEAIEIVSNICGNPSKSLIGLTALKELLLKRQTHMDKCLAKLLSFATHPNESVRMSAIKILCSQAYPHMEMRPDIEKFATKMFRSIMDAVKPLSSQDANTNGKESDTVGATNDNKIDTDSPTEDHEMKNDEDEKKDGSDQETSAEETKWNSEEIRRRIMLLLALCALNHRLLDNLQHTFIALAHETSEREPKKTLIRETEAFIRDAMDPHAEWLMTFLEDFPDDAGELALRIVQVLVDKTRQGGSQHIIFNTTKNIYFGREQKDAQFLVPIAHVLTRDEILSSLKDLIMLDDNTVAVVIDKILTKAKHAQAILPAQLLVSLHQLNGRTQSDKLTKKVIFAINTCFLYKNIFKKNVLAAALQQLVELDPLPLLLMRTVIQSANAAPEMSNVIMDILSRLVRRNVWEDPLLWQGFVKCAMMPKLVPQSFNVFLQLPLPELKRLLSENPALRKPMDNFVADKDIPPEVKQLIHETLESEEKQVQDNGQSPAASPSDKD